MATGDYYPMIGSNKYALLLAEDEDYPMMGSRKHELNWEEGVESPEE